MNMAEAIAWQAEQLLRPEVAGVAATYEQGGISASVTVVPEGSGDDSEYLMPLADSPEATSFAVHQADQGYCSFLVRAADLAAAGIRQPAAGDKIRIGAKVYPMTSPAGGESWMPIGETPGEATWFRIHTKQQA